MFCFGPLRIFYAQKPLVLQSKKTEELLVYLVCRGGSLLSKKSVAETIWPGRSESQAMCNLYKTLEWFKNLRQKDIDIPIISKRGTIGLDSRQIYSDLWEFDTHYYNRSQLQNCQRAVELYTGPVLSGAPYDWIAAYEAYYELSCAEMLELLSQQLEKDKTGQFNFYQRKLKILTET